MIQKTFLKKFLILRNVVSMMVTVRVGVLKVVVEVVMTEQEFFYFVGCLIYQDISCKRARGWFKVVIFSGILKIEPASGFAIMSVI